MAEFVWVYDCGSDHSPPLNREITRFRGVHVNLLFLSHLDDDHVSGVDRLLHSAAKVSEVVLPYLDDTDRVLHLAASASSGGLTGTYIDLMSDPAEWFGSRGVDRITYIGANGDDDLPLDGPDPVDPDTPILDGKEPPLEIKGPPIGKIESEWTRSAHVADPKKQRVRRADVAIAESGAVSRISLGGWVLDWVLSPFAYKPSAAKMVKFQKELDTHFGPGLSAKEYANQARTARGRYLLRKCYNRVWKTHNLHAMALYAGPTRSPQSIVSNTSWYGRFVSRVVQPGWLSFGDFDLSVARRRRKLIQYYWRYSAMVGHISLPHHGSDHSFHSDILSALPNLSAAIAAVGPNSYGHPGMRVQAEVGAHKGATFVRVDENPGTRYKVAGVV